MTVGFINDQLECNSMSRPWTDKSTLKDMYWEEEMTQNEIADELNCSLSTIERWFRKHDIETRDPSVLGSEHGKGGSVTGETPWRDREKMYEQYVEQDKGVSRVADYFGCTEATVRKWRNKHGIEPKDQHTNYGGGIPEDSQIDTDRVARYVRLNNTPRVYSHQLLAIAIGYDPYNVFSGGEYHIHHKNQIPFDNRPDNIELIKRSDHTGNHTTLANKS